MLKIGQRIVISTSDTHTYRGVVTDFDKDVTYDIVTVRFIGDSGAVGTISMPTAAFENDIHDLPAPTHDRGELEHWLDA